MFLIEEQKPIVEGTNTGQKDKDAFCLFFETGFLSVVLAVLELTL